MKVDRSNVLLVVVHTAVICAFAAASPAIAQSPLFAVGNRVWFDTDNSGAINGGETGIDGVTVDLYAASDLATKVATTTTAHGGYYLFSNLGAGDYVVAIAASNFSGVLRGYWSSGTSRAPDGAIAETAAPAANSDVDSDDNGTLQASGSLVGAVTSSVVTLGPGVNSEPTGETDLDNGDQGEPDGQANMTVDFGFYRMELGNLVWNDGDNDGLFDHGESGINGVTVELRSGDGGSLLGTTMTSGGGVYSFGGLPAGSYVVRLPAVDFNPGGILRDFRSSTGPLPALAYEPAPDPNTNVTDSDDNGTQAGPLLGLGGYIQSLPVTLTPGHAQSTDNATGTTFEDRIDFGVNNLPQIDLSASVTDGTSTYSPGAALNYVVVVTNHGPADANGMSVSATRPPQISSWTWTCDAATPPAYNCTGDGTNPAAFSDSVDLPQLASVTYQVTAQVGEVVTGSLSTQVVAIPPVGMSDMTPGDNIATDVDALAQTTLSVTKTGSPDPVPLGGTITYTVQVTNTGSVDATGLTVADTLPPGVAYQSAAGSGWDCAPSAGVVTCTLGFLGPGAAPPITIAATVQSYATQTNSVTASAINAAATDATARTRVTPPAIPAANGRGFVALALLVVGIGGWLVRRTAA